MKLKIFSDGGSRGNPGPAGIGVLIMSGSKEDVEISKFIGDATNNQAEYKAVIEALKYLSENFKDDEVEAEVFLDSQLVVEQLKRNYKQKNEGLRPLFLEACDLVSDLGGKISFNHIPREQNKIADRLVNQALDNRDDLMEAR